MKLNKNAILSGFCACLGSCFGKLSSIVTVENNAILYTITSINIALMLLFNGLVWTFFVKALQSKDCNTATATVTSSGANYILSALLGWLIFGETNCGLYWFGIFLIIIGLAIINKSDESPKFEEKLKKN
ncbi:transmembrane protein 42-like [Culicoides brevitarsis]|uniref:transmembrane protein 42-like n=1 Tax=Culicoides brevitarsis TaxID=469753 RepID=UPI00307C9085